MSDHRADDALTDEDTLRTENAELRKAASDRAVSLLLFLERIEEATRVPEDKREDLGFMRSAIMTAHGYAGAALTLHGGGDVAPILAELRTRG